MNIKFKSGRAIIEAGDFYLELDWSFVLIALFVVVLALKLLIQVWRHV